VSGPLASAEVTLAGARVEWEPRARALGASYLAGGAPWRLVRLPGASRGAVERWRHGGVVRAGEERLAATLVAQGILLRRDPPGVAPGEVEVVVPVRDHAEAAAALLADLEGLGLKVTLVDDGSRDGDDLARLAARHGARLVRRERPGGPAAARNAGLRTTNAPAVWFLDADVRLDDAAATLERLSRALGDPQVAAAAARVRGPRARGVRGGYEERHGALDLGPHDALVVPGAAVSYVPAACLLARREALGDGFDEALLTGEDVDLAWRLVDRGWRVRYVAGAVATHAARPTWRAWWRQRQEYGRSASALAPRHGSRVTPVRLETSTAATWVATLRSPALALTLARRVRDGLRERLGVPAPGDERVAEELTRLALVTSAPRVVRSLWRSYGPVLVTLGLLTRRWRPVVAVAAVATVVRLDGDARPSDAVLSVVDDLAYASGLWRGAWERRSAVALAPVLVGPLPWRGAGRLARPR
jgi:mycofactocin system glycosyltransferase